MSDELEDFEELEDLADIDAQDIQDALAWWDETATPLFVGALDNA